MKRYWDYVIIGAMAIVIAILLFRCSPEPGTTTVTHDTIPGDPYPVYDTLEKPVPYQVILPGDTFWPDVDTTVILQKCKQLYKDYYTKNVYNDTLRNDTSMFIAVIDTVYQNKLQKRILSSQNKRITTINTTTTIYGEIPVNKFYLGAGINGEVNPFFRDPTITLNGLLVMKKRWSYEVEVGFPIKNIENIRVGIKGFYKLSFKKR